MLVFTDIDAVNDDSFNHKRNRTSAISESVASIANYPTKLRIYLTNRAGRNWVSFAAAPCSKTCIDPAYM